MKQQQKLFISATIFLFMFVSINPAHSATALLNKTCNSLKATTVSAGKKLVCTSKSGKKIWTMQKVFVPTAIPNFSLKYENSKVSIVLIASIVEIKNQDITSAELVIYTKVDGNYIRVGSRVWNSDNYSYASTYVAFDMDIAEKYKGSEMAVEIRYINQAGTGERALKSIPIPAAEPTPTATPTPTPAAVPTPKPVTSAAPTVEVGCSVNYISPLPYASQRMSVINMAWEKDSLGYVFVNMSIRNDNSMALRLVEFTYSFMHKGSIIFTTSTLEGNHHFFIQDDAKFNSSDGISGAWMPGQTRVFKIPTNQMLECKSISVLSSGYTVKQGIGAN